MKGKACICAISLFILGCSGIRGQGEASKVDYTNLCVERNASVIVPAFESDLVYQLERRGLNVRLVDSGSECDGSAVLTYIALRSMGKVTKVKLSIYKSNKRIAHIDWDAGRSPMPSKVSKSEIQAVEFWQTAEALAGLFGDIEIKK